jgi:hypothetical protein
MVSMPFITNNRLLIPLQIPIRKTAQTSMPSHPPPAEKSPDLTWHTHSWKNNSGYSICVRGVKERTEEVDVQSDIGVEIEEVCGCW